MADVVVTLSGDEATLLKALQKIIDKQKSVDDAMDKTKKKSDETKQVVEKTFSVKDVANYVASLASITTVLDQGMQMWQRYQQAQKNALSSLDSLRDADQKLAQVAEPGQLPALLKQADAMSVRRGVSREETRDLLFSALSDNFYKDVDRVARASDVVKLEEASIVAGQTRNLFKNDPTSVDEALSMTLKASQISRVDFGPMAKALPNAAEGAAQINSTLAETLATEAILAGVFKSGDTAADRIKAFASKAALSSDTKNLGLLGAFDFVNKMSEEDRATFLGDDQEKNAVFNAIKQNYEQIRNVESQLKEDRVAVSAGRGYLNQQIAAAEQTQEIAMRRQVASSRLNAEIAEERRLVGGAATSEISRNTLQANLDNSGMGFYARDTATRQAALVSGITEAAGFERPSADSLTYASFWNPLVALLNRGQSSTSPDNQAVATNLKSASDSAAKLNQNLQQAADAAKVQAARAQAAAGTQP